MANQNQINVALKDQRIGASHKSVEPSLAINEAGLINLNTV